jgi:hypothetical protein
MKPTDRPPNEKNGRAARNRYRIYTIDGSVEKLNDAVAAAGKHDVFAVR